MPRFIAEISSNHNGDLKRCLDLIRAAAACDCWGVKFQLFRIEHLFAPEILQISETHRRRRRWELPWHFLPDLASCARDEGLAFGCTPFHLEAVDTLRPHLDFLKVASYELPWLDLIRKCGETGLPLMMSCGMANETEIIQAVNAASAAGVEDLTVFHCVSNYPVAAADCNLAAIGTLKELLGGNFPQGKVGWSDHSVDPAVVSRAVDHWKCDAVEFHFDLEGKGDEFGAGHCWLPQQIQTLIHGQKYESDLQCDGSAHLVPTNSEQDERLWRADPSDGLRPTQAVRKTWPPEQAPAEQKPKVMFLAGGPGLGHLVRLLAVAQTLRSDHQINPIFVSPHSPGAKKMLARHGFASFSGRTQIANLSAAAVVIDQKEPCEDLIQNLKHRKISTVAIDRPDSLAADLVIVPSFGWQPDVKNDHHFGGTRYQLVRGDILRLRPDEVPPVGSRIVVSFGAEDPNLLTEKTAAALSELPPEIPVQFIIGPDFRKHRQEWPPRPLQRPGFQIIETNDPLETILPGAGLLITAMGVTIAEAHVLGIAVAVLTNYPSDESSVRRLLEAETVANLGYHADLSHESLASALVNLWANAERRQNLAAKGWQLTDGQGADRAARIIARLLNSTAPGEDGPC